jgi:solute carrier family 25 protein 44
MMMIVPCDVVSQHLMILGQPAGGKVINPLDINYKKYNSKFDLTLTIARRIHERDGLMGFYRGYLASLCTYVPTSAMWWSFYQLYQGDYLRIYLLHFYSILFYSRNSVFSGGGGKTQAILELIYDFCYFVNLTTFWNFSFNL